MHVLPSGFQILVTSGVITPYSFIPLIKYRSADNFAFSLALCISSFLILSIISDIIINEIRDFIFFTPKVHKEFFMEEMLNATSLPVTVSQN